MEKRINNVEELEKIYYQNCGRIMHGEYSVLGHGLRPFTLVQEICYLYKLNNEKMCQALDEVLKEYKVTYDIRTLDISDIPNEICE